MQSRIGERIKEEVKAKHDQLSDFYNEIPFNESTVSGYLNGHRHPSVEFLAYLASLKYDILYILTGNRSNNKYQTAKILKILKKEFKNLNNSFSSRFIDNLNNAIDKVK